MNESTMWYFCLCLKANNLTLHTARLQLRGVTDTSGMVVLSVEVHQHR